MCSSENDNSYSIEYKPAATRDAKKLDKPVMQRIRKKLKKLCANPGGEGAEKLKGTSEAYYRIRVGDYRVLFERQDDNHTILVLRIGDRKDVYNNLDAL